VKCPSCEFDSFQETDRCKKCGHVFGIDDAEEEMGPILISSVVEDAPEAEILTSPLEDSPHPEPRPGSGIKFEESPINAAPAVSAGLMTPESLPAPTGVPPDWKAELDQRVQTFRKRRARVKGASDSNPNLEFDFEEPAPEEATSPETQPPADFVPLAAEIDFERAGESEAVAGHVELESVDLAPLRLPEPVLDRKVQYTPPDYRPVEFVLDPPPAREQAESGPVTIEIQLAPMTRRVAGGLIDAAVLLFSAGVFALIFWRAGGHASTHPITLLILSLVVVFHVLVYFGAFTAIIAATPGLLWMGIEVRSWAGGPPTLRQAIWRALGCLVSASAILLGFIWALFDNESLTWHDRMSETYLAPSDAAAHHEA
jgi:uncharacterized RDD family membrane protein YckC